MLLSSARTRGGLPSERAGLTTGVFARLCACSLQDSAWRYSAAAAFLSDLGMDGSAVCDQIEFNQTMLIHEAFNETVCHPVSMGERPRRSGSVRQILLVCMALVAVWPTTSKAQGLAAPLCQLPEAKSPQGVVSTPPQLWPQGVVPYEFNKKVTPAHRALMLAAINEFALLGAPVTIRPRVGESDYVQICNSATSGVNYSSTTGKLVGGGKQVIAIDSWNYRFVMVHEWMHALGFDHEHQRPDRDRYVSVPSGLLNNPNYTVIKHSLTLHPYDYNSVMHYANWTGIAAKPPHDVPWNTVIGQRSYFSSGDIRNLQVTYGAVRAAPAVYGHPTTSRAFVPTLHSGAEYPYIGSSSFHLIARNLEGQSPGTLMLALKRASFPFSGIQSYLDPFALLLSLPIAASGRAGVDGDGEVVVPAPIAKDTSLTGTRLFAQEIFVARNAKLESTSGLWLTLSGAKVPPALEALQDYGKYRKYATSVDSAAAVWNAAKITGLTYMRAQRFEMPKGNSLYIAIGKGGRCGMEFCLIPGGSYRMGSNQTANHPDETPEHWVHLEPFLLARKEVTQAQFFRVVGKSPWLKSPGPGLPPKPRPGSLIGAGHAANYIDWYAAVRFCRLEGWRLPSESEWEYACRAGTQTDFFNGSNCVGDCKSTSSAFCVYRSSSLQNAPAVPGRFPPNAFGLLDMAGNVSEWCEDAHYGNYIGAPANGYPWELAATASGIDRIRRGGDFSDVLFHCRSAGRRFLSASSQGWSTGLRPARSLH